MVKKKKIDGRKGKVLRGVKGELKINERGSLGYTLLFVFILMILGTILLIIVYMLYMNIPGEPEQGSVFVGESSEVKKPNVEELVLSNVKQFYPDTKFNHNDISYKIDEECDVKKKSRILEAFNIVSENINSISFMNALEGDDADIVVICSEEGGVSVQEDYFIAGEGGAKEIIQTGRYNIITNGIILLYNSQNSKTSKCNYPGIELHELMHVFGFDHSEDKGSLMYPYLDSCKQVLDDSIIKELERLYSEKNLADLFFDDVLAVRRGRYLDFNLTIKNSGVIDAQNVKYSILDEGELVQDKDLEGELRDITYGAGVIISITGFKLINRNSEEIRFVIDRENKISEIDESNNEAVVRF